MIFSNYFLLLQLVYNLGVLLSLFFIYNRLSLFLNPRNYAPG